MFDTASAILAGADSHTRTRFMTALPLSAPPPAIAARPRRWRRALLWGALIGLLLVAQSLLVWFALDYESNRAQEQAYAHARPVYQALDDHFSEASTLNALGDVFARTARAGAAEEAYAQARDIFRALGERLGEAHALQPGADSLSSRRNVRGPCR